jgi:glucan endo-1,3-alpha-glucosidase
MYSTLIFILGFVAATLVQAMPLSPFRHQRLAKRDGNPKIVAAHHMVGNTYPYTQNDWLSDINQAHAAGIDAFALNIGTDPWQPTQVAFA